jgi:hypothetical protein
VIVLFIVIVRDIFNIFLFADKERPSSATQFSMRLRQALVVVALLVSLAACDAAKSKKNDKKKFSENDGKLSSTGKKGPVPSKRPFQGKPPFPNPKAGTPNGAPWTRDKFASKPPRPDRDGRGQAAGLYAALVLPKVPKEVTFPLSDEESRKFYAARGGLMEWVQANSQQHDLTKQDTRDALRQKTTDNQVRQRGRD